MKWAVIASLLLTPPAAKAQSGESETSFVFQEKGWQLYVDHTANDGCYINKETPAMAFRVQHDPSDGRVYAIIMSRTWKSLDDGKTYPLKLAFDKKPIWDVSAVAFTNRVAKGLTFWVNDFDFIAELSESHFLTILTGDKLVGSVNLSGSARALEMLATCKLEMEKAKDPFADQKPEAPSPIFIPADPKAKDDPFHT